jgi:hypothetical protein
MACIVPTFDEGTADGLPDDMDVETLNELNQLVSLPVFTKLGAASGSSTKLDDDAESTTVPTLSIPPHSSHDIATVAAAPVFG